VQPGTTCGVPTQTHEVFDAYLKQSSGLSIIGGTPKLTLDVSFSRTHYLNATNPLTFLECVDANGDFVQPPFSPAANTIQYDPDNGCNRVVTVSIDYLDYCNFNVEDSADGTTTVFSGELTLNTAIDFTTPFQFTRYNRYPLLFFITFDRTFSVTTNIEVFNPNQCEDSTDCNGYPCIMFPEEGIKKCNCTDPNGLGSNTGEHCEVDGQCPTFFNCPDGTVTVVPLVTALPGQLNQVLSNVPTYADNQLSGQIFAERTINGVSLTTSPTGTDDLLTYNFPLGVTGVTYTARDETGNECECNFQVNVTDALAPVVDCPPDLITNVWDSWAEPTGTDLIDQNIHFWVEINPAAPATQEASYEEFCEGRPGADVSGNNHGSYHFYAPNWGFTHLDENGALIPNSVIAGYMAERTEEWCTNDSRCIGYYTSDSWTNVFFESTSDCLTVCNDDPTRIVHPALSHSATCQIMCVTAHNAPGPFDEATDKPCHQAPYGNEMTYVKILGL
jgi:hypothetical protein